MPLRLAQKALPAPLRREPINVADLYSATERGDVPASSVGSILDHLANEQTRWALAFGHITKEQVDTYKGSLLKRLQKHQAPLEASAYKRTSGVMAPVSAADWAITGSAAVGVPYLISKLKRKAITPGQAVSAAVGREALPYTTLGELVTILGVNPLRDPLYQRGERKYWKSVGEGMSGQIEDVGRKSEELRKKYGLLGLPLQAVHGVLNPISSVAYAGRSLKDYLSGPQGPAQAKQAELRVSEALKGD